MPKDKKITVTDFFALSNCLFTPLKISGKKAIPGKYLWDSNSVEVMRQCKVCGDQRKCHGDQIPMIRCNFCYNSFDPLANKRYAYNESNPLLKAETNKVSNEKGKAFADGLPMTSMPNKILSPDQTEEYIETMKMYPLGAETPMIEPAKAIAKFKVEANEAVDEAADVPKKKMKVHHQDNTIDHDEEVKQVGVTKKSKVSLDKLTSHKGLQNILKIASDTMNGEDISKHPKLKEFEHDPIDDESVVETDEDDEPEPESLDDLLKRLKDNQAKYKEHLAAMNALIEDNDAIIALIEGLKK